MALCDLLPACKLQAMVVLLQTCADAHGQFVSPNLRLANSRASLGSKTPIHTKWMTKLGEPRFYRSH